jgi:hypothetical protein
LSTLLAILTYLSIYTVSVVDGISLSLTSASGLKLEVLPRGLGTTVHKGGRATRADRERSFSHLIRSFILYVGGEGEGE